MTVGIYIRVSTLEQAKEGYSIAAQKERLLAYCKAMGWDDYKLYVDEGVSAKDTNRPYLKQLLTHVEEGKISTLLVYRLDRFTRKVKDLHKMLEFLEENKCSFKSATEPYDTSTAMGKLFITIVAALAEWETDNLSERVKMALEEKVSGGERVGAIPFGFDLSEEEKLVKNEKSAVVLDIIDKIKKGMSANQVANHLTKTNSDKMAWHPTAIFRILQNPAIYGATRWNDKVYENTHEGLITKSEFIKLQQILEDRSQHKRRDVATNYIFQGALICPQCNSTLSVNRHVRKRKDGSEYQGAVYKCQVCWKAGRFMISIGEHRFLKALMEYMKNVEIPNVEPKVEKDDRSIYMDQLKQVEKRREKYQRAWSMDKMTDEEFDKLMDETRLIYDDLKKKISEIKAPVVIDAEAIKKIIFTFNQNFASLTQLEKRMFISQFIRKIEFKLIPQLPTKPKYKKGKDLVVIKNVEFY